MAPASCAAISPDPNPGVVGFVYVCVYSMAMTGGCGGERRLDVTSPSPPWGCVSEGA